MMLLITQICLALFTVFVMAITSWIYKWWNPPNSLNGMQLPPGSMGLPLIGETIEFIIPSNSLDMPFFLKKRIKKYGKIFKTNIVGHPAVVSVDPEFNQYILLKEGKYVELWYLNAFNKVMGHDDNVDDPETKLNAFGRVHKYLRSSLLNHIGKECLKKKLLPQLHTLIHENINAWTYKESIELKHASSKMMFALTAKLILSYDVKNSEDLTEDFLSLFDGFMSWPINVPGTNYHSSLKGRMKLFKIIEQIVKERIQSPDTSKGDLLDELVHDMGTENFITEQFVVNIVLAFLAASLETISTALTMSVKLITENLEVVQQLEKEYEEILQNRSTDNEAAGLTWEEYESLTYTAKVIKETLRLSSAPGILRRATKDIHYSNASTSYIIPKGWVIMIALPGLHLNPDIYEDCLTFNPSRWKDNSASDFGQNYIPFGGGGRPCAGAAFTKAFLASFLHVLVSKYRWTKLKEGKVKRSPFLKLDGGYHIKVSKRNP